MAFDQNVFKCIFANSNPNLNPNSNLKANPKAQKRFRENEMISFFGKVTRYRDINTPYDFTIKRLFA